MNISKFNGAPPTQAADQTSAKGTGPKGKVDADPAIKPGTAKPAEVRLSPLSEKLKQLSSEYASSALIDGPKVAALRDAIAKGTFKVNAGVVADKMIAETRELNGRKS